MSTSKPPTPPPIASTARARILGGLGLLGLRRDQAKGLPAGTNVPSLDLGLAQAALHIEPSGAQLQSHPIMTDRLLVSQARDCHISGDERELCRMHPGVFSRRQRPVPCELGRASGLQVLGHLAVQRSTTVRRYSQVQRLAHQIVCEFTSDNHTRRGRFDE